MKIIAEQRLETLEKILVEKAEEVIWKKENEPKNPNAYTPENRLQDYEDELERARERERNEPKNPFELDEEFKHERKGPPSVYHENGEIRQCNEGRYDFKIIEDDMNDQLMVDLFVPKFLGTELIDCDLNPSYVRFSVKDKITQLKLPEEIEVEKSKVERSTTTGALRVTCPTVYKRPKNTVEYKKMTEEYKKKDKLKKMEKEMKEKTYLNQKDTDNGQDTADKNKEEAAEKQDQDNHKEEEPYVPDFDLDELPDLE